MDVHNDQPLWGTVINDYKEMMQKIVAAAGEWTVSRQETFVQASKRLRLRLRIDANDRTPTVTPRGRRSAFTALYPHSTSHFAAWIGATTKRKWTWTQRSLPEGYTVHQLGDLEMTVLYPMSELERVATHLGCVKRR